MTVFVILLIFLLLFLLWPRIIAWLRPHIQAWMLRRIEKHIRRAAGIPDEEPRDRRRSRKTDAGNNTDNGYSRHAPQHSGPIIPREYAEDVEYTETIDYSSDTTVAPDGTRREHSRVRVETHESQVSDAEWEEIKPNKHNRRK